MEGICQVGAWWMAQRLPHGRTMGYGCPTPLAGGGVAPSNADTRVITALLATAMEEGKWRGGRGMLYTYTCTLLSPSFLPVLQRHQSKVMTVMKARRAVIQGQMDGWRNNSMDNEICMLICYWLKRETAFLSPIKMLRVACLSIHWNILPNKLGFL